jgi:hypothetical protein
LGRQRDVKPLRITGLDSYPHSEAWAYPYERAGTCFFASLRAENVAHHEWCKKQMDSGRLPIHILKQVFFDLDPRFKGDDARTKIDGCIGKNILQECVTPRRYTSHDEQECVPI